MTCQFGMCSATLEEYTTSKESSAKGSAAPSPRTEPKPEIPAADSSETFGSRPM